MNLASQVYCSQAPPGNAIFARLCLAMFAVTTFISGVGLGFFTIDHSDDDFALLASFSDHRDRPVSDVEFARLHALLKPQSYESRWAKIPWLTSLWDARKRATAEGKPLFVWVISDGSPCGLC